MESDSDSLLIARVASRDAPAFGLLVNRHAPVLHRIAARITGDANEAEDITQEAMLRLWDQAPQWNERGITLAAWLRRMTVNLAIDRHRRSRRVAGSEIPDHTDDAPLADICLSQQQDIAVARRLIAALPERQRAAIVLTYYEELSNAEAAAALDMKVKAFESLLLRARTALRTGFAQLGMPSLMAAGGVR